MLAIVDVIVHVVPAIPLHGDLTENVQVVLLLGATQERSTQAMDPTSVIEAIPTSLHVLA